MRGLLLAEKLSVMRAIKEVYSKETSYPHQLDFGAFHGHLMELKAPEEYRKDWEDRKNTSILPMFPNPFEYRVEDKQSVDMLLSKIQSGNYDFLINACDAGREGEHIFWSFYETTGLTLPVKRFWASSTTKPALKKALYDLKDSSIYDGMRQASKYRAQFDWLVGMNFTRAAGAGLKQFVPIGRVQSPTLKLIVDKERQIQNFKPENFWEVKSTFQINGSSAEFIHLVAPDRKTTRFTSQTDADAVVSAVNQAGFGVVAGVKEDIKSTDAPTLYSLAELQKAANRYFKYKPDKTLALAQKLYEDGLLSYPRTESRFLPTDMVPELPAHIAPLASVPELAQYAAKIGQPEIDAMLGKKYVNDAGITDHHAIIPTDQAPNWSTLSKDEQALYTLVGKAFLSIFMPPYQAALSTILVTVGTHVFRAQGRCEIDKGYSVLWPAKKTKDVTLPACKKGDKAAVVKISAVQGTTKPPQRYTPDTILSAMQNAGQDLPDSAMRSILRESAGLGTSATRADILKKLEERNLVEVKSNFYYALGKGIAIIDSVGDRTFCSALLTAQWEEKLRSIEDGTYKGDFRAEMESYVQEETTFLLTNLKPSFGVPIGTCPHCGGKILEYNKFFTCENRKKNDPNTCPVWAPKLVGGVEFSKDDLLNMLNGQTLPARTFTGSDGSTWNAFCVLDPSSGLKLIREKSPSVGKCPICGSDVIPTARGYVCEHHKKDDPAGCPFWLPKTVGGTPLSAEDVQVILSGQTTSSRVVKTKTGKDWTVAFCLDENKAFQVIDKEEKTVVGSCPICGKPVYASTNSFYCSGKVDQSCSWSFPRTIKGTVLKDNDLTQMLKGKKTRLITFTWVSGKRGKARLFLKNADLQWEFA